MGSDIGRGSRLRALYDALLVSIGDRAREIEPRPVVTHAPHLGSAYRGLVLVGQALHGWPDDWQASEARTRAGRSRIIERTFARNADRAEPMDWIETSPNRDSPWWTCAAALADLLEPGPGPWFGRLGWVNLYPAAPEAPPDNPRGALRAAQDGHVAGLLRATLDEIGARTVVALVGPYWWPAGSDKAFASLVERPRPLMRSGMVEGRRVVVGWHPNGARYRGIRPEVYARMLADELRA